jgi:hypothetical protein
MYTINEYVYFFYVGKYSICKEKDSIEDQG